VSDCQSNAICADGFVAAQLVIIGVLLATCTSCNMFHVIKTLHRMNNSNTLRNNESNYVDQFSNLNATDTVLLVVD
jgi:hypothetical protein